MSRNLSAAMIAAVNAAETDECAIPLITITHPDLAEPINLNNVGAEVVSNGVTYSPFPFDIVIPQDDEESVPRMTLTIDNTDQTIMAQLRPLNDSAMVTFRLVLSSDPDHVEIQYPPIPLKDITANVFDITAVISAEDYTAEPFPGDNFSPNSFPAIF